MLKDESEASGDAQRFIPQLPRSNITQFDTANSCHAGQLGLDSGLRGDHVEP